MIGNFDKMVKKGLKNPSISFKSDVNPVKNIISKQPQINFNVQPQQQRFSQNQNFDMRMQRPIIPQPVKRFVVAEKSVHVYNSYPIPNKKVISNVYNKIPDDTNIPLKFMTREQYVQKYVANQEVENGVPFPNDVKQQFFDYKKDKYKNIIGRYTTKSNPYHEPAVVVFNDPENQKNIQGKNFKSLAWHEYGHELAERNNLGLKSEKEEYFADRIAEKGMNNMFVSDVKAKNKIMKEIRSKQQDNITMDGHSKNELVEFKNLKIPVYKNPTRAESKDIYERAIAEGIHGDTPKFRKTFDTEGNRYEWMSNDAIHKTVESQLLHEKGTITNQNQHFDIAYDRLTEDEKELVKDKHSKNMAWAKPVRTDYVVDMDPKEFLERTLHKPEDFKPTTYYDKETGKEEPIGMLSQHIKSKDVDVDLPYLDTTDTNDFVTSEHEGRHRAFAAQMIGEKTIPVIVPPPQSWRTDEIKDEFLTKTFPKDLNSSYGDQWRKRIDSPFPTERMDLHTRRIYTDILEDKGLVPQEDKESKDSDIHLKHDKSHFPKNYRGNITDYDIKKMDIRTENSMMNVNTLIPNKIYIGSVLKNMKDTPENIEAVSQIVAHEELHNVLRDVGENPMIKLDNLATPALIDDEYENVYSSPIQINYPSERDDKYRAIHALDKTLSSEEYFEERKRIIEDEESKDSQIYLRPKLSHLKKKDRDNIKEIAEKQFYNKYGDDEYTKTQKEAFVKKRTNDLLHPFKTNKYDGYTMFVNTDAPDKIYIGDTLLKNIDGSKQENIDAVSEIVAHEEMHNILTNLKPVAKDNASSKYDNIVVTTQMSLEGKDVISKASAIQFPSEKEKKEDVIKAIQTENNIQLIKDVMDYDIPPERPEILEHYYIKRDGEYYNPPEEDTESKDHRYTKIIKEKDRTIYENPEGKKIIKYKKSSYVPTVDDVAYVMDNLPVGYNVADISLISKQEYTDEELLKLQGYYDDQLRASGEDKEYVDSIKERDKEEFSHNIKNTLALFSPNIRKNQSDIIMFGGKQQDLNYKNFEETKHTLVHEIGHALDYNVKKQQDHTPLNDFGLNQSPVLIDFVNINNKFNPINSKNVTENTKLPPEEDLAESFVQWNKVLSKERDDEYFSGPLDDERKKILDKHFSGISETPTGVELDYENITTFKDISEDEYSKDMPFVKKTGIPSVDYPKEYSGFTSKTIKKMSPEQFLSITKDEETLHSLRHEDYDGYKKLDKMSLEEYRQIVENPHKMESIKKGLEEGKNVPGLHLEYNASGTPIGHEGRNRAFTAMDRGDKELPVSVMVTRPTIPVEGSIFPRWDWTIPQEDVSVVDEIEGEFEGEPTYPYKDEESKDMRFEGPVKQRYPESKVKWMDIDNVLDAHKKIDGPDYDITRPENQLGTRIPNAEEFIKTKEYEDEYYGGFQPPLVNTKGSITDGRHRLLALKNLGYTEVPVEVLEDEYSKNMPLFKKDEEESDETEEVYYDYRGTKLTKPKGIQGISTKHFPSVDDVSYFYDQSPIEYLPNKIRFKTKHGRLGQGAWADVEDGEILNFYPKKKQKKSEDILFVKEGDYVKFKKQQMEIKDAIVTEDFTFDKDNPSVHYARIKYINPSDNKVYEEVMPKTRLTRLDEDTGKYKKVRTKETVEHSPKSIKQILMHETGHIVDHRENLKGKYEYEGLDPKDAPSEYAQKRLKKVGHKSGVAEDIAETFSEWHPDVGSYHKTKRTVPENNVILNPEYKKRLDFLDEHLGEEYKKGMTPRDEYEYYQTPESYIDDALDPRGDLRSEIYPEKTEEEYQEEYEKIKNVVDEKGEYTIGDIHFDEESKNNLLKKTLDWKTKGKRNVGYSTPDGTYFEYELGKRVSAKNYPTPDEVAYVLENLPNRVVPKNTKIVFSPRTYKELSRDVGSEDGYIKIPTKIRKRVGGTFKQAISEDEDKEIRIYPRDTFEQKITKDIKLGDPTFKINTNRVRELPDYQEFKDKYDKKRFEEFRRTLLHEAAHAQESDKFNLIKDFEEDLTNPVEGAPTDYGKTNPSEDLAESFVYWAQNKKTDNNLDLDERKQFFDTNFPKINPRTNPSIRERFEEIVTPENIIKEDDNLGYVVYDDDLGHSYWEQTRQLENEGTTGATFEVLEDNESKDMAIRWGRKPKHLERDEWEQYKKNLDKQTHKETTQLHPTIRMNTILGKDREIKRLNQANMFFRDEDWHLKYNEEATNALREQGYNEDDIIEYLSEKHRKGVEAANYFAKQFSKEKTPFGEMFKKATEGIDDISDEEGVERYKDYMKSTQSFDIEKVKDITPKADEEYDDEITESEQEQTEEEQDFYDNINNKYKED